MDEAEEVVGLVFIAICKASEAEKPREQPLHFPSSLVASKASTVGPTLGRHATDRSDQLDVLRREVVFELRTVVRLVADELLRLLFGEALLDGSVDETYFVTLT